MTSRRAIRLFWRRAADERGFGLLEMLISMVILTIGIGGLVSVFSASALSLHRTAERGTALTLAESQMEIYRTVNFAGIRLNTSLVPTAGTDQYVKGHSQDANIPPSTNQAAGGSNGDTACPDPNFPAACLPVQTVTGPDGAHQFKVDTYINYVNNDTTLSARTPAAGLTLKLVTVVIRDALTNALLAEDSSAFQGP